MRSSKRKFENENLHTVSVADNQVSAIAEKDDFFEVICADHKKSTNS